MNHCTSLLIPVRVATLLLLIAIVRPVWAEENVIQPGDRIEVKIHRQPRYSGTYAVDGLGRVQMPLVGLVEIGRLSPAQAQRVLENELSRYLRNPVVSIAPATGNTTSAGVLAPMEIYVLGAVPSPGPYRTEKPITVLQLMSMIGDVMTTVRERPGQDQRMSSIVPKRPDLSRVLLVRTGEESRVLNVQALLDGGDLRDNITLADGDTLVFPAGEASTFSVFGQVGRQGVYQIDRPVTIADALVIGGGLARYADYRQIRVFRGGPENPETLRVDFAELVRVGDLDHMPMVQAGDTVWVPRNLLSKIDDLVSLLSKLTVGTVNVRVISRTVDNFEEDTGLPRPVGY